MFHRILVALDDLGDWEAVVPHLRTLVRPGSSRVYIVQTVSFLETIVEMPYELSPGPGEDASGPDGYVAAIAEKLSSEGIRAEGSTHIGRGGQGLAAAAERVDASLIVVVARPRHRLVDLVQGTSCALYVVPPEGTVRPGGVVVPFDGTTASLEALPSAAALAPQFGSRIIFLRTADASTEVGLAAVRERLSQEGLTSRFVVPARSPAAEVLRLVRESRAPLLILRRPVPLPPPEPGLVPGPPLSPALVALWTHRISSAPQLGPEEPGD
jgi:nucleotide-binding universal stress UspA family protein